MGKNIIYKGFEIKIDKQFTLIDSVNDHVFNYMALIFYNKEYIKNSDFFDRN